MAIVNVKVGSLVVPMDLEFLADARANLQYILKVLGVKASDVLPQVAGISPPGVALKFDIKEQGGSAFPGGTSLQQNAIQEHISQSGRPLPQNPGDSFALTGVKTVEVFDPNDPTFEPPYPADRFPDYQVAPAGLDMPVKNI